MNGNNSSQNSKTAKRPIRVGFVMMMTMMTMVIMIMISATEGRAGGRCNQGQVQIGFGSGRDAFIAIRYEGRQSKASERAKNDKNSKQGAARAGISRIQEYNENDAI